ncbi:hypothetical protein HOY80DRAFT_1035106 [Tuber brumale]|nr:hypothetical protein HOY80DRAFT_1067512 [Tuber brumale]KAG0642995.1 hypothetical protein HOY80DRAFT_1035106 [Tuber brumale]
MRIFFGSFTFTPWALRPTAYSTFTHFAPHQKLVSSRIEFPSHGTIISRIEFHRRLSKLEAFGHKQSVQQREETDKQLKEVEEEKKKREPMQQRTDQRSEEKLDFWGKLLLEKTERMKLEQNFNIRGALERIVFQARLEEKICSKHGTQKGLNELSQKREIIDILEKVVEERCLVPKYVKDCFPHLYYTASRDAHGNDSIIAIRAADFAPNDRAALVVFLRLQSTWSHPLDWKEVPKGKK